jgi:hypothetical protein
MTALKLEALVSLASVSKLTCQRQPMTALKLEALVVSATAYDGSEAGGSGTV